MQFNTNLSTLKNGVRVLTVPMLGNDSVTSLVLVKTGSRNESESDSGISHILEHMVLKSTKKYPTQSVLSSTIDSMGANHNAFTGKEYTGYYISAATRHLNKSIDILADVVSNPLLLPQNLQTEKGVIIEEFNMYQDLPMRRSIEEFENLIFQGSNMGRFIEGTPATINATSADGLRSYLQRWYRGGNVLVVIAGNILNISELLSTIDANFSSLQSGEVDPYIQPSKFGSDLFRHLPKKTEQAHFVLGVPGLSMQDPSRHALNLASVVLGGPMSSRLFNEIREKRGLAYYVHSDVETNFDAGYFAVRAGVKLDKLSEAIDVVKHELLTLASTFTEKELQLGKDYILGRLPLEMESSMDVAQFFGQRVLMTGEIQQPQDIEKIYNQVTVDDIKAILNQLVKENLFRTVVVGPSQN